MSLLSDAEAALREIRRTSLAEEVVYQRSSQTLTLLATQAATQTENDDGRVIIQSRSIDWIIEAADLILNGIQEQPKSGDRIHVARGGGTRIFEAMDLGSERHFRFHGRDYLSLRIHTKEVLEPIVTASCSTTTPTSDALIVIRGGQAFAETVQYVHAGQPVNIDGADIQMELRDTGSTLIFNPTTANDGITVTDAVSGQMRIQISPSETTAYQPGSNQELSVSLTVDGTEIITGTALFWV